MTVGSSPTTPAMGKLTKKQRLQIINSKIDWRYCDKTWVGEFTPSEILFMIKCGVKYPETEKYKIKYIIEAKKHGESSPCYFYFYPNYELFVRKE